MNIAIKSLFQENLDAIRTLLEACELPTSDLSSLSTARFFGIENDGRLAAVVGLEIHGDVALLRSLAVAPDRRGGGVGCSLVSHAEDFAANIGVRDLYLLTVSAKEFFPRLGYRLAARTTAPAAIKATTQFSGLCPDSAAFMHKSLA